MISFYCVSFNDEERKEKMVNRFKAVDLELKFIDPVFQTDERVQNADEKRTWSIMLQHLDSIRDFYENTTNDYVVVCEDDILISKNINTELPTIIKHFEELELDVLLLGYLIHYSPHNNGYYPTYLTNETHTYFDYPNDLWGSQMYLVSRKHAKYLLEHYTIEHAIASIGTEPYSSDWTITKKGKKAIIYPMLAVEEGATKTDHGFQNYFHQKCHEFNYNSSFI